MTKQWMKIFACIAFVICCANNVVVHAAPTGLAAAVESYLKPAADAAEEKIKDCTGQGSLDSTGECSKVLKTILRNGAIDSLNQQLSFRSVKGLAKEHLLEYAEQFQKDLGLSNAEFVKFKAGLQESITGNAPVFLRTMKCNTAGKCRYLLFTTGPYKQSKLEILTLKSTMSFSVAPNIVVVQQTVTDPETGLPAGNKIVMKEVPKTKENGVDDVMVYFDKYVYQEMKKAFHNNGGSGNGGYDGPKPPTQVNPFANLFDENDNDGYRSMGEDDFGFAFDTSNGKVQGIQRYSPNKEREQALIDACYSAGLRGSEARQFMAQCSHECDNFNTMEEYASGAAYEGRSDLGNTQPGDGKRFKGRGYIQLTGRANYIDVGRAIGENLVDNPERAKDPRVAAKAALHFWKTRVRRRVSNFCDTYAVTRVINGGTNGLSDRKSKFAKYGGCDGISGGGGGNSDPDHKCTATSGKCADSNTHDCSTGFRSSLCSGSYSRKCCTGTITKKGSGGGGGGGSSPGGSSSTCLSCLKGGGGKGCASRCPSNFACQNCVKFGGGAGCLINAKCGTCAGTCFNKYSGKCSGSVETSKCPGSSSIVCCASGKLTSGSMYDTHHSSGSFTDVGSKVIDLGHKITNLDADDYEKNDDDDFHNRFKKIVNRAFNRCVRKCFRLLGDPEACISQCKMDGQEVIEESKGIAQQAVNHIMDAENAYDTASVPRASDGRFSSYSDVGHEVDTQAGSRNLREALNPSSGNWKYDLGDGSSIRNMLVNHQVFDEQSSSWKENIKNNFGFEESNNEVGNWRDGQWNGPGVHSNSFGGNHQGVNGNSFGGSHQGVNSNSFDSDDDDDGDYDNEVGMNWRGGGWNRPFLHSDSFSGNHQGVNGNSFRVNHQGINSNSFRYSFDEGNHERSDPYHGLLRELVGFGQRTTGGKGGKVCKVTNHGDSGHGSLRHCVEQHGPTWIRFDIDGDIRLNSYIEIRHSDITIDGRGRSVTLRGKGLKVSSNNVIIAHLGFNGDGGGDDAIQVKGQYERIWIHRCSLSNYHDGLIDLTRGATDITVSWNKFTNHRKVMLIGSSVEDTETKNTRVTIHHNWFKGTNSRHPRVRYAKVHLYNNYYEKWGFYAVACSQESECYSEKNLYKAGGKKKKAIETKAGNDKKHGKVESHGDKFENGAEKDVRGSVFKPSNFYGYSAESTGGLANRVRDKAGK